jgi:uncharacterized protein YegP (UPF0339 family)
MMTTDDLDSARADPGRGRCRIDADAKGGFGWRVIAPNGRVVAVSARQFDAYAPARRAFETLCRAHAQLTGAVQHTGEGNGWMWLLRDAAGAVVAVSARPYERHSTCRAACRRFLALLPELAEVNGSCP